MINTMVVVKTWQRDLRKEEKFYFFGFLEEREIYLRRE
jgi:hypothetical protein